MTRAPSLLLWFGLIIAASLALYHTSDRVQELNHQLHSLDTQIDAEQQSLHVLNAEWAYLASPAHIRAAAKKHLALRPTSTQQIATMNELDDMLPEHKQARAAAPLIKAEAPPVAIIKTAYVVPTPHVLLLPKQKASIITANAHVSDRIKIERTASVQTPGTIGALITQLNEEP